MFGLVERIIAERSSYSLDRYVVPAVNRALRRAMGKDVVSNLVECTKELRGGRTPALLDRSGIMSM